jgi:hypothetical protein
VGYPENCISGQSSAIRCRHDTLVGTGIAGHIVLKAAPTAAECTDVPICIQAYVPINFAVKIGYASQPIYLTLRK